MGLKIAIDGIYMATNQPGGYRTYTKNLVSALAQRETRHEFHLLVDRNTELTVPGTWRVDTIPRSGSLGFIWREQIQIPSYVADSGVEVMHMPAATGPMRIRALMVVTIHDTIEFTDPLPSLRLPKLWAMRAYSRLAQARAVHTASHIITVSEYSKREIIRRFKLPPNKVTVTYNAPSPQYSLVGQTAIALTEDNEGVAPGFILGIASLAPRKNVRTLLAAYSHLPESIRRDHLLVLVCTHAGVVDTLQASIEASSLDGYVRILQNVTDQHLVRLYQAAGVFVFPSFEEGFGLPPLEAMACGTPVVASNTSSLPEVCGNAAILVNPGDVIGFADAISTILMDSVLADTLRTLGFAQCRKFSWEKTAQQTLAVYEAVKAGLNKSDRRA